MNSERPDTPQRTHGGHLVLPAWLIEFQGDTEVDALEQAATWIGEIGSDTIAVCCSDLRYCDDGYTILAICYQPAGNTTGLDGDLP